MLSLLKHPSSSISSEELLEELPLNLVEEQQLYNRYRNSKFDVEKLEHLEEGGDDRQEQPLTALVLGFDIPTWSKNLHPIHEFRNPRYPQFFSSKNNDFCRAAWR